MNFGRAVRICRATFGMRQSELADRLKVGRSQLSLIESGKRQPSVRTVSEIAEAFGIPVHLLTLLASEAEDLKTDEAEDVHQLGKALLELIVSSSEQPHQLPLVESSNGKEE